MGQRIVVVAVGCRSATCRWRNRGCSGGVGSLYWDSDSEFGSDSDATVIATVKSMDSRKGYSNLRARCIVAGSDFLRFPTDCSGLRFRKLRQDVFFLSLGPRCTNCWCR